MHPAQEHLRLLIKAKAYSDKGHYKEKRRVMGPLLAGSPDAFVVDSPGRMAGITHIATGFKMHVPNEIIPSTVQRLKAAEMSLGLIGGLTRDKFRELVLGL